MDLREQFARAIWAKRPDCIGKLWPLETAEQRRRYPHFPIAAVDLCFVYADACLAVLDNKEQYGPHRCWAGVRENVLVTWEHTRWP